MKTNNTPHSECGYSPAIKYSHARDRDENFNAILDRVEQRINRFKKRVNFIENEDGDFNQAFPGISNFLYEASDFSTNTGNHFEKRFNKLADRLWKLGIHPSEF